jgi:hypothetical protein
MSQATGSVTTGCRSEKDEQCGRFHSVAQLAQSFDSLPALAESQRDFRYGRLIPRMFQAAPTAILPSVAVPPSDF